MGYRKKTWLMQEKIPQIIPWLIFLGKEKRASLYTPIASFVPPINFKISNLPSVKKYKIIFLSPI